jgi:LEA14-like dessication related protein
MIVAPSRHPVARLIGLVLALFLAGCASLPPANLQPPDVSVADFALTDIGLDRLRFRLELDADNPNDFDMPLRNVRLDLTVFDVVLAEGFVVDSRVTLPALASRRLPVVFTVPTSRLLDVMQRFRGGSLNRFTYRLAGSARWGNTPFEVPFERSGDLDTLRRLLDIFGGG